MNQDLFGSLKEKLTDLASGYSLQLRGDELNAYFSGLSRFPLSVALGALDAAPILFPTAFPTVNQIIGICDDIAAKERRGGDTVALLRAVDECPHEYEFEPEPEDGLYAGFDVCVHCGRAVPRANKAAPPIQLEYFRMAVNPKGGES
ncbi:MAG TPA: hypothetical protein VJ810_13070 [Blastocatellia bacterium]|nr:hypothetical protein [Blastocatellia bacterium]